LLGISGWNNTKFSITLFHRKLHYHPIDIKKIKDSLKPYNFKVQHKRLVDIIAALCKNT